MRTINRVIAAGIVSAATLVVPVQTAVADPNAGTAVVVTGDDYYVSADSVTVHHHPTKRSAVVEIARRGDVLTAHRTHVADVDAGSLGASRWLETTNRRTGAHGYVPQSEAAKPENTERGNSRPETAEPTAAAATAESLVAESPVVKPCGAEQAVAKPGAGQPDTDRSETVRPILARPLYGDPSRS